MGSAFPRKVGMRKYNFITGVIWLIIATLIFSESLRLGLGKFNFPGPGFFPFLTTIPLAFLSLMLIWEAAPLKRQKVKETQAVWAADTNWGKIILTLAALISYVFLLEQLGYLLGTFLLMLFLFKSIEPQKWIIATLASIAAVGLSYFIFNVWLQCQFPEGILLRIIRG